MNATYQALPQADAVKTDSVAERNLVRTLLAIFEKCKSHKEKRTGAWASSYEFVRRRQWEPRPGWRASPVTNLVFSKTEHLIAQLTANRPTHHVQARRPAFKEHSDSMQRMMDFEWKRDNMPQRVHDGCWNAAVYSVGIYHTYWDSVDERPRTECIDPRRFFIDEKATDIDDCGYCGTVRSMSMGEILRRWPKARKKAGTIKPGYTFVEVAPDREPGTLDARFPLTGNYGSGSPVELIPRTYDLPVYGESDIQVMDWWIRDPSVIETELNSVDPETGKPVRVLEPLYPYARHIILAGGAVIVDERNPYEHGEIPHVLQFAHRVANECWCISFVENLLDPQKRLNKLDGIILENAGRMANAQWLVPVGSMDDPEAELSGEAGLVIEYKPLFGQPHKPERISGEPLPAFVFQARMACIDDMDNISGEHDVSRGQQPTGVTAGVAIEALQQTGQIRLGPLIQNLETAIERFSRQRLALIQQYVREARSFRVSDEATGESIWVTLETDDIKQGWDLEIVAGSTLPKSRDARFREAAQLKELGVFDERAVLEYTDHPGRERLLKRLTDRRAAAMDIALQTGLPPAQIDPSTFPNREAAAAVGQGGQVDVGQSGLEPPAARRPQVEGRGGGFYNQP